ncbi:MAG: AraC family transcriptional regulator [Steroidobacter sp.]
MKTSSRAEYLKRIDRVIERLSGSIANDEAAPSIAILARHANLSEFHFMRVYRALAGESLGSTIQRLRLQRAIHLLARTSASIAEIAGRVGYETPQAFAKAFRQVFDAAPSDVRERPDSYRSLPSALSPAGRNVEIRPAVIRIEIVELQPFRVAALRNDGDYADLDQAYSALFSWMAGHGAIESVQGVWGAPHHDRRDTPPDECVFDCCLSTSAALTDEGGVRVTQLGGGRYAVYRHVGDYLQLDDAHDVLLRDALPANSLALRDAPILHRFLNDPEGAPTAELETDIHIPVE